MRKNSKENIKSLTVQSSRIFDNPRRPWEDVCYALGGLEPIVSKFARFKYAGEERHHSDVLQHIYHEIMKMGKVQGWKHRPPCYRGANLDVRGWFALRLAELALQEAAGEHRCKRCHGRGIIHTGYKNIDCWNCEGSGEQKMSDKYRAKFMGMSGQAWRMAWRYRFRQHILGIFDVFEFEIAKALHNRL